MGDMRIHYASDLHLDKFQGGPHKRFAELKSGGLLDPCDVLILAGDVVTLQENLQYILKIILEESRHIPRVFFVPGNHEYYVSRTATKFANRHLEAAGKHRENLEGILDSLNGEYANFYGTGRASKFSVGRQDFLLATLWTGPRKSPEMQTLMNDYNYVPGLANWEACESAYHEAFIRTHVNLKSIVVTHHLPSVECLDSAHVGSLTNAFYVNPYTADIRAKAWIHGHSHSPLDLIGESKTRYLRAPAGYENERNDWRVGVLETLDS